MPVTIPVDEPTVAMEVLLLLHTPPPVTSDNVEVVEHMVKTPLIPATETRVLTETR